MKIGNLGQIHRELFGKDAGTNTDSWLGALRTAVKRGKAIAMDGRFYVPTARYFDSGRPNVSAMTPPGMRWEKGELIPRYAHRA